MRKLLALLLLAILPLTPSWAGVAVECPGEAVAAALAQPPGADVDAADPDCCAEGEARDVQCGSDCTACHGPGLMALTGVPPGVGPLKAGTGDSTHACRLAAPVTSAPLRPPSRTRA